jgi:hypothetical protein
MKDPDWAEDNTPPIHEGFLIITMISYTGISILGSRVAVATLTGFSFSGFQQGL